MEVCTHVCCFPRKGLPPSLLLPGAPQRMRHASLMHATPYLGAIGSLCGCPGPGWAHVIFVAFHGSPFATNPFSLAESTSVKLKSKQEEIFEVEKEVACRSVTVKNMVEDTGLDTPVPLPMVDSKILIKVIEYCKYHHKAEQESLPEDEKNTWDKDFVKVDDETLFNLILAANYLDIKSLLDLTCKTVADEIKGKTPEEIRVRFNIKNDFTPEEEEEVKRENAWCEER